MFQHKSYLSVKVGEREYQVICDTSSPLSELIDVLGMISKNVQKLLDEAESEKSKESDG